MYARGAGKRDAGDGGGGGGKHAELLVFGYACKVFRDDPKALFHDDGKHLIPWMGDKNITIDRSVEKKLKQKKRGKNVLSYNRRCTVALNRSRALNDITEREREREEKQQQRQRAFFLLCPPRLIRVFADLDELRGSCS